uniref:Uncharacterized protein n=1 Tax=Oryza punctata TaxID=4537 RepID=A0A0E0LD36_ORYPU
MASRLVDEQGGEDRSVRARTAVVRRAWARLTLSAWASNRGNGAREGEVMDLAQRCRASAPTTDKAARRVNLIYRAAYGGARNREERT